MTDRELLEECHLQLSMLLDDHVPIIPALRARLAEPEPEPVAGWRGLSTAERKVLWNLTKKPSEFAELIEAKLKERNP